MELINWDTIEILKSMEDSSIDLIVSDPPYKCITWGTKQKFGWWFTWIVKSGNHKNLFKYHSINIKDYIDELYRVLKDWSHCYLMTNNLNLEEFLTESKRAGFKLHNLLIWEKWNKIISRWYMKSFEPILFLRKWPAKKIKNLWHDAILRHPNPRNKTHPTEKPVSLMQQMIQNSSEIWDIVLDPFMWTWATCIACCKSKRKFIWIELDEDYFNIAKQRIIWK